VSPVPLADDGAGEEATVGEEPLVDVEADVEPPLLELHPAATSPTVARSTSRRTG